EAFLPRCFLHNRRDLNLAERHEGLKSTLATHQIVRFAICGFDPTSDGNGFLETKTGNIGHDALESVLVPASRIEDIYLIYGDHLNGRRGIVHAAPVILARWAMPKKKSRVTKRYVSKLTALSSASNSFSKVMSRLGRR